MGFVGDDINIKSSLNILKFISSILFFHSITWQVGIVILSCLLILISGFLQLLTKSQE